MNKKIFFVTNGLSGGGAERVMSIIANHLENSGYQVSFLMLKKFDNEYPLNQRINRFYKKSNRDKDFLGDITFIRSFMKQEKDAIFISFFTRQSLYTLLASIGTCNSVIVSERNDPSKTVSSSIEKTIRSLLYASSKCKTIVFQTEGARKYFDINIQNKGVVVLNPIKSGLPEKSFENDNKTIVSVGRLTEQKNYSLLLKAFSIFNKEHPDYSLKIYGKGELEDSLKSFSKCLGIEDKVVFCGFKDNLHEEIADASMFVMSSDYEGLSNALLEAMAMGIPCVSTDSPPGGARMVIQNGVNGILVPVGDENELAKAMNSIANNKEFAKFIGKNSMKIIECANIDKICNEWKNIIDNA